VIHGVNELAQDLEKDQAYFGQKLDVRRLTEDDFKERQVELSRDLKARMEKMRFITSTFPSRSFPGQGGRLPA